VYGPRRHKVVQEASRPWKVTEIIGLSNIVLLTRAVGIQARSLLIQVTARYLKKNPEAVKMSTFTYVTKLKRMTCVLATISILTFPGPFMSTSPAAAERLFYVSPSGDDSNPGIEEAPWKTIGKAARTLVSGDTAIVMDGTYTEPEKSCIPEFWHTSRTDHTSSTE
jgi:hypothetical protein